MLEFFRTKQIAAAVFATLALLLAGCLMIAFGLRHDAVTLAGKIKSGVLTADQVSVSFEVVGGKVLAHFVKESDDVHKAMPLMQLDATDIELSIESLKAQDAALCAQLEKARKDHAVAVAATDLNELSAWRNIELLEAARSSAQASLTLAELEYKRFEGLFKARAASRSDYEKARATLITARASLVQAQRELNAATIGASPEELEKLASQGSAEGMTLTSIANERLSNTNILNQIADLQAQIASVRASLRQQEINLQRLRLTAPEDGRVLKVLFEDGEVVPNGAAAILLETRRKYYDIYVDELTAARFGPGTRVQGFVPALDRTVAGTVRFATAAASFSDLRNSRERGQSDLTNFQVRIYTDETPGLLTGMTVEVR